MAQKRNIEGQRLHHFELSDKNRTVRWVLIIILLVIGAVSIIWALTNALNTPSGWQSIQASSGGLNCSHEFALQYDLGAGEKSATQERKELSSLYTQLTQKAWLLFYWEAVESDTVGLSQINSHPNAELQVDEGLYKALEEVTRDGNRSIYLGPVYAAYDNLFQSEDDTEANLCDPTGDPGMGEYVQVLAGFANDPDCVALELRGENRVFLKVSDGYLQYLEDSGVERILDFGWLRNAFVIDYMADALKSAGFENGYIFSVDGHIRNLDKRNQQFTMNIVMDGKVAAIMDYAAPMSIVSLRSYPTYEELQDRFYTFADGRTVSAMVDPADGQSRCATSDLIAYDADMGCARLAMMLAPAYIADTLPEDTLTALTKQGIYTVWKTDNTICYTQEGAKLTVNISDLTAVKK